jgi:hypothetical protein
MSMILMHGDRASERRGLQNHSGRERYPDRAPVFKPERCNYRVCLRK